MNFTIGKEILSKSPVAISDFSEDVSLKIKGALLQDPDSIKSSQKLDSLLKLFKFYYTQSTVGIGYDVFEKVSARTIFTLNPLAEHDEQNSFVQHMQFIASKCCFDLVQKIGFKNATIDPDVTSSTLKVINTLSENDASRGVIKAKKRGPIPVNPDIVDISEQDIIEKKRGTRREDVNEIHYFTASIDYCELCQEQLTKGQEAFHHFNINTTDTENISCHAKNYLKKQMELGFDTFYEKYPVEECPIYLYRERFGGMPLINEEVMSKQHALFLYRCGVLSDKTCRCCGGDDRSAGQSGKHTRAENWINHSASQTHVQNFIMKVLLEDSNFDSLLDFISFPIPSCQVLQRSSGTFIKCLHHLHFNLKKKRLSCLQNLINKNKPDRKNPRKNIKDSDCHTSSLPHSNWTEEQDKNLIEKFRDQSHNKKASVCFIESCPMKFYSKRCEDRERELREHWRVTHMEPTARLVYQCREKWMLDTDSDELCGMKFMSEEEYRRHLVDAHCLTSDCIKRNICLERVRWLYQTDGKRFMKNDVRDEYDGAASLCVCVCDDLKHTDNWQYLDSSDVRFMQLEDVRIPNSAEIDGLPYKSWTAEKEENLKEKMRNRAPGKNQNCIHHECVYHKTKNPLLTDEDLFLDHWKVFHMSPDKKLVYKCSASKDDTICNMRLYSKVHFYLHLLTTKHKNVMNKEEALQQVTDIESSWWNCTVSKDNTKKSSFRKIVLSSECNIAQTMVSKAKVGKATSKMIGLPFETWSEKEDKLLIQAYAKRNSKQQGFCIHPECEYHKKQSPSIDNFAKFREHWRIYHMAPGKRLSFDCLLGNELGKCDSRFVLGNDLIKHLQNDSSTGGHSLSRAHAVKVWHYTRAKWQHEDLENRVMYNEKQKKYIDMDLDESCLSNHSFYTKDSNKEGVGSSNLPSIARSSAHSRLGIHPSLDERLGDIVDDKGDNRMNELQDTNKSNSSSTASDLTKFTILNNRDAEDVVVTFESPQHLENPPITATSLDFPPVNNDTTQFSFPGTYTISNDTEMDTNIRSNEVSDEFWNEDEAVQDCRVCVFSTSPHIFDNQDSGRKDYGNKLDQHRKIIVHSESSLSSSSDDDEEDYFEGLRSMDTVDEVYDSDSSLEDKSDESDSYHSCMEVVDEASISESDDKDEEPSDPFQDEMEVVDEASFSDQSTDENCQAEVEHEKEVDDEDCEEKKLLMESSVETKNKPVLVQLDDTKPNKEYIIIHPCKRFVPSNSPQCHIENEQQISETSENKIEEKSVKLTEDHNNDTLEKECDELEMLVKEINENMEDSDASEGNERNQCRGKFTSDEKLCSYEENIELNIEPNFAQIDAQEENSLQVIEEKRIEGNSETSEKNNLQTECTQVDESGVINDHTDKIFGSCAEENTPAVFTRLPENRTDKKDDSPQLGNSITPDEINQRQDTSITQMQKSPTTIMPLMECGPFPIERQIQDLQIQMKLLTRKKERLKVKLVSKEKVYSDHGKEQVQRTLQRMQQQESLIEKKITELRIKQIRNEVETNLSEQLHNATQYSNVHPNQTSVASSDYSMNQFNLTSACYKERPRRTLIEIKPRKSSDEEQISTTHRNVSLQSVHPENLNPYLGYPTVLNTGEDSTQLSLKITFKNTKDEETLDSQQMEEDTNDSLRNVDQMADYGDVYRSNESYSSCQPVENRSKILKIKLDSPYSCSVGTRVNKEETNIQIRVDSSREKSSYNNISSNILMDDALCAGKKEEQRHDGNTNSGATVPQKDAEMPSSSKKASPRKIMEYVDMTDSELLEFRNEILRKLAEKKSKYSETESDSDSSVETSDPAEPPNVKHRRKILKEDKHEDSADDDTQDTIDSPDSEEELSDQFSPGSDCDDNFDFNHNVITKEQATNEFKVENKNVDNGEKRNMDEMNIASSKQIDETCNQDTQAETQENASNEKADQVTDVKDRQETAEESEQVIDSDLRNADQGTPLKRKSPYSPETKDEVTYQNILSPTKKIKCKKEISMLAGKRPLDSTSDLPHVKEKEEEELCQPETMERSLADGNMGQSSEVHQDRGQVIGCDKSPEAMMREVSLELLFILCGRCSQVKYNVIGEPTLSPLQSALIQNIHAIIGRDKTDDTVIQIIRHIASKPMNILDSLEKVNMAAVIKTLDPDSDTYKVAQILNMVVYIRSVFTRENLGIE